MEKKMFHVKHLRQAGIKKRTVSRETVLLKKAKEIGYSFIFVILGTPYIWETCMYAHRTWNEVQPVTPLR